MLHQQFATQLKYKRESVIRIDGVKYLSDLQENERRARQTYQGTSFSQPLYLVTYMLDSCRAWRKLCLYKQNILALY